MDQENPSSASVVEISLSDSDFSSDEEISEVIPAPGNLNASKNRLPSRAGSGFHMQPGPSFREGHHPRVLPHTLVHGELGSSGDNTTTSDPYQTYQTVGFGEENVLGNERIIFQAALQDLSQPRAELDVPQGILSVSLLRHQKIALAWMVEKETRTMHCMGGILADDQGLGKTISTIALIIKQLLAQLKSQLEKHDNDFAEALNLDDDDDDSTGDKKEDPNAGKCKSAEVSNSEPMLYNLDDDDDDTGSGSTETVKKMENVDGLKSDSSSRSSSSLPKVQGKRPSAGTLIVCPATVLRQWARELSEKVAKKANLSVLLHHGSFRTKDPKILARYDVVLTTYAIVSNEVPEQPIIDEDDGEQKTVDRFGLSSDFSVSKKRKHASTNKNGKKGKKAGPLARVNWFRVVLDEARIIQNHRTQTARACCRLRAKRRWCLSGAPIQNSVDEIYSYFKFLQHDLYSRYENFYYGIKNPISRDPTIGYRKLQAVLKTLLLRRTKGLCCCWHSQSELCQHTVDDFAPPSGL